MTDIYLQRQFICPLETDTMQLANLIATNAFPGLVVTLNGPLGAGKTAFAKGFARGLEIDESITSPTYPIIQEYQGRLKLYHMDLYRLSGEDEVLETGAGELLDGQDVCLVEWPIRAAALFENDCLAIQLSARDDNARLIQISTTNTNTWNKLKIASFPESGFKDYT